VYGLGLRRLPVETECMVKTDSDGSSHWAHNLLNLLEELVPYIQWGFGHPGLYWRSEWILEGGGVTGGNNEN